MMRMQVRSVQVPRWTVPVLILLTLALIPFALVLALAAAGVAVAVSALRLLGSGPAPQEDARFRRLHPKKAFSDPQAIDADYEVKDE